MKIVKVEAIPISIPRSEEKQWSYGSSGVSSDFVLVKLETDNGMTGLGEAPIMPHWAPEVQETSIFVIKKYIGPMVVNQNPFNIDAIMDKVESLRGIKMGYSFSKSALEMALYDLMGKCLGVPVYNLLGGGYRNKVATTHIVSLKNSRKMADEAVRYAEKGIRTMKLKTGKNWMKDIEAVKTVREAVGEDIAIRIDANGNYTPKTAVRAIKMMEKYNLEMVEQPVPGWDLEALAEVRKSVNTPILVDESLWTVHDAIKIVRGRAADIFNIWVPKSGGLRNATKIVSIAEAAGIRCLVGGGAEFGVGRAANLHFAAAIRNLEYASDIGASFPAGPNKDDIIDETLKLKDGFWEVPSTHGLGIRLNEEKCKKYTRVLAKL